MSSDEAVRTAGALDLNDFSPDAESPTGYIDIEAFQAAQYGCQISRKFSSKCGKASMGR